MKYLIIGNGAAAVSAAEGIRSVDPEGSVTMVSREKGPAYSRPLISFLLEGRTDEKRMLFRGQEFYSENRLELMDGVSVTSVSVEAHTAVLDNGETLSWDALLLACGSVPFIPPAEGMELLPKRHTFLSLPDARALESSLFPEARVLIMGAGLIGMKCAEAVYGRCGSITVVDPAPRALTSILDDESAAAVSRRLAELGITLITGDSVKSFSSPNTAVLASGGTTEFDVPVFAAGVRPDTALARSMGCEAKRGIVTDEHMRTTVPGVFAAGDCAEVSDVSAGVNRPLALWPAARACGFAAGICMAGGSRTPGNLYPMNSMELFGLRIATAGSYDGDTFTERGDGFLKKLFCRDGRLRGLLTVGDVEGAGIYASLIRSGTPLYSVDFELLRAHPGLAAFSRTYRDEKLGGKQE